MCREVEGVVGKGGAVDGVTAGAFPLGKFVFGQSVVVHTADVAAVMVEPYVALVA